jgi:hypothetical protein
MEVEYTLLYDRVLCKYIYSNDAIVSFISCYGEWSEYSENTASSRIGGDDSKILTEEGWEELSRDYEKKIHKEAMIKCWSRLKWERMPLLEKMFTVTVNSLGMFVLGCFLSVCLCYGLIYYGWLYIRGKDI